MASFKDRLGRQWDVEITTADVVPLRDLGWDVGPKKGTVETTPLTDPETLGRVLWLLCEEQALKRGLSPEQFARGFNGPANWAALEALGAAVAVFTQPPKTAAASMARLAAVMGSLDEQGAKRVAAGPTPTLPEWSDSATSTPASPGSPPAP